MIALLPFALTLPAAAGPVIWIDDSLNGLHTVDLETRQSTRIGAMTGATETLTDIAMSPAGQLWGISNNYLWRIDRTTAAATRIGAHRIPSANALTFDDQGRLFGAGATSTRLYTIDTTTGVGTALTGSMGAGAAGDIAFVDGALYLADTSGRLTRLILSGSFPYAVSPIAIGTFSAPDVFGLALASDASGRLFATAGAIVYTVNTSTAALEPFSSLPASLVAFGATSEAFASMPAVAAPPDPSRAPTNLALLRDLRLDIEIPNPLLGCSTAGAIPASGRRRNLVLLVHGWNSNPDVWARPLRDRIAAMVPGAGSIVASEAWDLCVLDWNLLGDLGSATITPRQAYANAPAVAASVAATLRDRYRYMHLIAHSAGSRIIDLLTRDLKGGAPGTVPLIHATYLDAYEPSTGVSYGCFADWAESYVDTRSPDPFGVLRSTNRSFACTLNFDVTQLDPVENGLVLPTPPLVPDPILVTQYSEDLFRRLLVEETRVHAWPVWAYAHTAALPSTAATGLESPETFSYFFGLSKVSGRVSAANPNQWIPLVPDRDSAGQPDVFPHSTAGLGRGGTICLARRNELGTYRSRTVDCSNNLPLTVPPAPTPAVQSTFADFQPRAVNDWLTLTAQSTPSTTGRVTPDPASGAFVRLTNGSPVWVTYTARLAAAVDTLRFSYQFTPGNTGNGLLSVFVDNQLVYRTTQALTGEPNATSSGPISIGRLEAGGFHTVAFRLDMLTDVPSEVTLSAFEIGTMTVRTVTNVAPTAAIRAPGQARLGSRVQLDGTASRDDDPNPTPLTFRWTALSGPAIDLADAGSLANPAFVPTAAGDYQFQLVVTDLASPSAAATATVRVPVLGDVDFDGDVDHDDISAIRAAISSTPVTENDVRDINADGALTEADAIEARGKCTVANCGDPVSAGPSSSGGGGAISPAGLLGLALLVLFARARSRKEQHELLKHGICTAFTSQERAR